jgi:F-type H+-transporting ATPase subunit epsilon
MADTMQFDLVSPERMLMSAQAAEVQIPGADGDLTAMPGHTPVITTLRPGLLSVSANGQTSEFAVSGGFAEVTADGVSVMAERSIPRTEATAEVISGWLADARAAGDSDAAAKTVADMQALAAQLGVSAA